MLRHKIMAVVITILLILAIFFGYKTFNYYKYSDKEFNDLAIVKFNGKMTINHVDLTDEEYLVFNDIKVKNIFDDYEKFNEENNTLKYINIEKKGNAIFIGSDDQFLYTLTTDEEYKDFFLNLSEKENIRNDLDLMKFFEKHNDDHVTYFMPRSKQKDIHTIKEVNSLLLPSLDYVKEIDGYYIGYIMKTTKNINDVNILINNKRYYFTFVGDYSEEFINEFMNSVIIG